MSIPFSSFFIYFSFSESALEHYIQRGKLLAKNPSESLRNIEDLIGNYSDSEVYNKLLEIEEYRHHGPRNEFFIALVLPSLTGKTQMAFAIRSKRPLYFAFGSVQQEVNKCFKSISRKFLALLENDHDNAIECLQNKLKSFEKRYDRKEEVEFLRNMLNSDFVIITLDTIEDYLRELKLKSLGFIAAVIKRSEQLYMEENNDEWMRFYAESEAKSEDLQYEPISLKDLERDKIIYKTFLEKYFIFMDEFKEDGGLVMFRNICRYLKVPCLVASTNPRLVNLIGTSPLSSSREDLAAIWCTVFPKLSYLTEEEVGKFFREEIDCKRFIELARNASVCEEERMRRLLEFFKDQAMNSRPGVSLFLFDALRDIYRSLKDLKRLNADKLFQNVIEKMISMIAPRKKNAFDNIEGIKANAYLMSGNAFDPKYSAAVRNPRTTESYWVNGHFFYLKNPLNRPIEAEPFLLFRESDYESTFLCTEPLVREEYTFQSFFDEKEELLKLVCLFADNSISPSGMFQTIGNNAFDGDELENITFAAFLE